MDANEPYHLLEYEEVTSPRQWASLVVFGRYEELPDTPDHQRARQVAERLFQQHPMWWEPATVPLGGHDKRPPIVFRIHVHSVTGRRTIHEAAPGDRRRGRRNRGSLAG